MNPPNEAAAFASPMSLPLQTIGILSALIFTLNFTLEILILFGQGRSHQLLMLTLLASLAVWVLCEAALLRRQGTQPQLNWLLVLLSGQLLIEGGRAWLILAWPASLVQPIRDGGDAPLSGLLGFLPAYGLMFLAISRALIHIHTAELDNAYRTIVSLEHSALKLTEAIPVGTYVLEESPQGVLHFTFFSQRWLEMLGVGRDEVITDPALAYRHIHPQDRDAYLARHLCAIRDRSTFRWEGRFVVQGETCWMSIEAVPRALTDGSTAFEGVMINITAHKEAQAALQRTHEQLTQVAIEQSRREERDQLLQDMHDGFGSQLASVRMMAEQGRIPPDELSAYLEEVSADLHLVVDTLSQGNITLEDAIYDMRYRTERRLAGGDIQFQWALALNDLPALSSRCMLQILRIMQEAMHNALRHAKAGNIALAARYEASADQLLISIQDDGIGMPDQPLYGRGMANMQHRAREIGAHWQIRPCHPGTRVELRLDRPGAGLALPN